MNIDSFMGRDCLLSRMDSRLKMIILLELIVMVFLPLSLKAMVILSISLIVLSSIEIGLTRTWKVFSSVLPVLLIMVLLSPVSNREGTPLLEIGNFVVITLEGMENLVLIGSRFVILTFGFSLLILCTRQSDIVLGLSFFGLSYRAGLTISLVLRFLPTLSHTMAQISDSHTLRQDHVARNRKIKEAVPSLISALVFALRSIPLSAMALEQRGFGSQIRPTRFHALPSFARCVPQLVLVSAFAVAFCFFGWH